jgi:hypothetical protein
MGHEARRRAGPIANEGDMVRTLQAGECALFQLYQDQRLRDRYLTWSQGRALVQLSSIPRSAFGDEATVVAAMERVIVAACRPPTPAEWDAVAQLLEALGVPCWRWAASAFVRSVFPHQAWNDLLPTAPKIIRLQRAGLVSLPRGRVPREQGSSVIRRYGDWWYRRDIKAPPRMTELELAREDAAAAGFFRGDPKTGEISRAKVYDGIEQFKNLLKRLKDDDEEVWPH